MRRARSGQFVTDGSIRVFFRVTVYFFSVLLSSLCFAVLIKRGRTPMPVLESTDRAMPRSSLRHRPLGSDAGQQMAGITPVVQRASRLRSPETEEDEQAMPGGGSTGPRPKTPGLIRTGGNRRGMLRAHPLLLLGLGMILMLVLWTLLTLAVSWWNTTWDDLHYGRPRTFQVDAIVGHNDSPGNPSHFIALNLNGRIEVIEFPGGDASKARIYIGPQLYGSGADLIPVTLSFVDVQGNHQPDLIIHIQGTGLVYINERGGFRPATSAESQTVEHYLKQHGQ
jgi:hypothetical protein